MLVTLLYVIMLIVTSSMTYDRREGGKKILRREAYDINQIYQNKMYPFDGWGVNEKDIMDNRILHGFRKSLYAKYLNVKIHPSTTDILPLYRDSALKMLSNENLGEITGSRVVNISGAMDNQFIYGFSSTENDSDIQMEQSVTNGYYKRVGYYTSDKVYYTNTTIKQPYYCKSNESNNEHNKANELYLASKENILLPAKQKVNKLKEYTTTEDDNYQLPELLSTEKNFPNKNEETHTIQDKIESTNKPFGQNEFFSIEHEKLTQNDQYSTKDSYYQQNEQLTTNYGSNQTDSYYFKEYNIYKPDKLYFQHLINRKLYISSIRPRCYHSNKLPTNQSTSTTFYQDPITKMVSISTNKLNKTKEEFEDILKNYHTTENSLENFINTQNETFNGGNDEKMHEQSVDSTTEYILHELNEQSFTEYGYSKTGKQLMTGSINKNSFRKLEDTDKEHSTTKINSYKEPEGFVISQTLPYSPKEHFYTQPFTYRENELKLKQKQETKSDSNSTNKRFYNNIITQNEKYTTNIVETNAKQDLQLEIEENLIQKETNLLPSLVGKFRGKFYLPISNDHNPTKYKLSSKDKAPYTENSSKKQTLGFDPIVNSNINSEHFANKINSYKPNKVFTTNETSGRLLPYFPSEESLNNCTSCKENANRLNKQNHELFKQRDPNEIYKHTLEESSDNTEDQETQMNEKINRKSEQCPMGNISKKEKQHIWDYGSDIKNKISSLKNNNNKENRNPLKNNINDDNDQNFFEYEPSKNWQQTMAKKKHSLSELNRNIQTNEPVRGSDSKQFKQSLVGNSNTQNNLYSTKYEANRAADKTSLENDTKQIDKQAPLKEQKNVHSLKSDNNKEKQNPPLKCDNEVKSQFSLNNIINKENKQKENIANHIHMPSERKMKSNSQKNSIQKEIIGSLPMNLINESKHKKTNSHKNQATSSESTLHLSSNNRLNTGLTNSEDHNFINDLKGKIKSNIQYSTSDNIGNILQDQEILENQKSLNISHNRKKKFKKRPEVHSASFQIHNRKKRLVNKINSQQKLINGYQWNNSSELEESIEKNYAEINKRQNEYACNNNKKNIKNSIFQKIKMFNKNIADLIYLKKNCLNSKAVHQSKQNNKAYALDRENYISKTSANGEKENKLYGTIKSVQKQHKDNYSNYYGQREFISRNSEDNNEIKGCGNKEDSEIVREKKVSNTQLSDSRKLFETGNQMNNQDKIKRNKNSSNYVKTHRTNANENRQKMVQKRSVGEIKLEDMREAFVPYDSEMTIYNPKSTMLDQVISNESIL